VNDKTNHKHDPFDCNVTLCRLTQRILFDIDVANSTSYQLWCFCWTSKC